MRKPIAGNQRLSQRTVISDASFSALRHLCSLRPDRVRLTLSCVMEIDRQGQVVDARIVESAIRSADDLLMRS